MGLRFIVVFRVLWVHISLYEPALVFWNDFMLTFIENTVDGHGISSVSSTCGRTPAHWHAVLLQLPSQMYFPKLGFIPLSCTVPPPGDNLARLGSVTAGGVHGLQSNTWKLLIIETTGAYKCAGGCVYYLEQFYIWSGYFTFRGKVNQFEKCIL